ncbi:MAG: DNA/RNA non-specific endonuclease [Prevotella sp.]|nr:DNA/RNA non-specific endonuclease [Prevotella sp.]
MTIKGTFKVVAYTLCVPFFLWACHDTHEDDWNTGGNTEKNENRNDTSQEPALQRLEFPKVKGGSSIVLIHATNDQYGINYSVEWDCDKKAQRWSAYQMNSATCRQNTTRYRSDTDQYPLDPLLPADQYLSKDCFWNSGFDHGHICPSADRLYSAEANYQTFFLTNMQPQYRQFNGADNSPWYRLESMVRSWANATTTETLYVVKGGTIDNGLVFPTKVKGEMLVPSHFFVALLMKNAQGYKAVGFWMEHKSSYPVMEPLASYAVNIRELEQHTGIDFFCNLPDETENRVETLPIENVRRAWGL